MTDLDQSARLDTARSLAAFLNLSLAHIRRLTREHRIPAIPVGDRGVRFDRAEVLKAFAARGKSTTTDEAGKQ
jgi:excisionase family DNA binding protein